MVLKVNALTKYRWEVMFLADGAAESEDMGSLPFMFNVEYSTT